MPYEVCSGASLYVNTAVADKLNFELDQATVDDAAEVSMRSQWNNRRLIWHC